MSTIARCSLDDAAAPRQEPLPLDMASELPIPYTLTVRARRAVAPGSLPALTVVGRRRKSAGGEGDLSPSVGVARDDPATDVVTEPAEAVPGVARGRNAGVAASDPLPDAEDLDDPTDTRLSRARALRRAGVPVADIATAVGAEPLVVRAWVEGVALARPAVRHGAPRRRSTGVTPTAGPPTAPGPGSHPAQPFTAARTAARADAAARLESDPAFACGLGLVTGLAEVDAGGVVLVAGDADLVASALDWLVRTAGVQTGRMRVILRLGPEVSGDRARQQWGRALGLPVERIGHTRWRSAPNATAVEALVQIPGATVAGTLAGWRDMLTATLTGDLAHSAAF